MSFVNNRHLFVEGVISIKGGHPHSRMPSILLRSEADLRLFLKNGSDSAKHAAQSAPETFLGLPAVIRTAAEHHGKKAGNILHVNTVRQVDLCTTLACCA